MVSDSKASLPVPDIVLQYGTLPVNVMLDARRKQAVGRIRNGEAYITVPKRWPQAEQIKAAQSLARRLQQENDAQTELRVTASANNPCLSFATHADLQQYVEALNAETFNVAINGARIGGAKYSRLAQINLKTRIITVSRYCLRNVPEPALRYLILHELAHTHEANHSPRFWRHVARWCPDWKYQSRVIKAIHAHAVSLDEQHSESDADL